MDEPRPPAGSPTFAGVADALRAMTFRSDFAVREIPAPATLAPDAVSYTHLTLPTSDLV